MSLIERFAKELKRKLGSIDEHTHNHVKIFPGEVDGWTEVQLWNESQDRDEGHVMHLLFDGSRWSEVWSSYWEGSDTGLVSTPMELINIAQTCLEAAQQRCHALEIHQRRVKSLTRSDQRLALELPTPPLTPNEDGEICCPGCGRMVGEADWVVELADVCGACERGLT